MKATANVFDERMGIHVGSVYVVEDVRAGSETERVDQKRCDISHVGHGLDVLSIAHHEKAAGGNLVEQVEDISTVAFAKNNGRPNDHESSRRIFIGPGAIDALSFELGLAVFVKRGKRATLIDGGGLESVNSDAAGKDDFLNSFAASDRTKFSGPVDIDFVIKRKRTDVVAMRCGEVEDGAGAPNQRGECIALADVTFRRLVREFPAFPKIADAEGNVLLGE